MFSMNVFSEEKKMRKCPCYVGARIFLPEQVFGHRNTRRCGHLVHMWEGAKPSSDLR
jgi:hypothetical protein